MHSAASAQDASGSLSLQMHFLGGPTQVALSLRAGHHIAVSGVLLLQQNAPVAGPLQAEWHEVGSECKTSVAFCTTTVFQLGFSCADINNSQPFLWRTC